MFPQWILAFAALASLVVSLGSLGVSIRTSRKGQESATRLKEIEEARERDRKKAHLWAHIELMYVNSAKHISYLRIENTGNALARDVDMQVDGKPQDAWPSDVHRLAKDVRTIAPRSFVRYQLEPSPGQRLFERPLDIGLTWTDDSGEQGVWEQTVTP